MVKEYNCNKGYVLTPNIKNIIYATYTYKNMFLYIYTMELNKFSTYTYLVKR